MFILHDAYWKDLTVSWAQLPTMSIRKKPSQWRNKSKGQTGKCSLIFFSLWAWLKNTCIYADCILKWSWGQLCKNTYTWPKGNSIMTEQKFLFSFFQKPNMALEGKRILWHASVFERCLPNSHNMFYSLKMGLSIVCLQEISLIFRRMARRI